MPDSAHAPTDATVVGRVVALYRYPVKSMAAEPLDVAEISWHGLAGDRRWAFVRNEASHNGFPWLTLRDRADMNHYQPSFTDPDRPDASPTTVRTPGGTVVDVTDPALAAELYPAGARVIRQSRGVFDTFPLALITTATIAALADQVGTPLDVARFRPNILVEADEDKPFLEDTWVGRTLRLGTARLRVDKRDGRCVVITIDPDTGHRNPDVLRAVAQHRDGCLGVYGTTVTPGHITLGDELLLEPATE